MEKNRRMPFPPFESLGWPRSDFITLIDGKLMITMKLQLWEMKEGKISKVKAGDNIYKLTLIETEEDIKQDIKQVDPAESNVTKIDNVTDESPTVVAPGAAAPAAGSPLNTRKKYKKHRAPANTVFFLNWLNDRTDPCFVLGDLVKETFLSKDSAIKIITYQLQKGTVNQMSRWEFSKRQQPLPPK